jgi:sulfatase maturation enzyme AslB (radical SAM superfamily)
MKIPIPNPLSGGLLLSYRCSATCRHCMYACSPKWDADWISEEHLSTMLSQLAPHIEPAPYGPDSISLSHGLHFTGGEAGLNFDLLCTAVDMAESLRIPSTFLETNAACVLTTP